MMSPRVAKNLALAAFMIAGTKGAAQNCLGLPDLSRMTRNISSVGIDQGANQISLTRLGVTRGNAFAGVQTGLGGQGYFSPSAIAFGGDMGYAIRLDAIKMVLCPQMQTLYQLAERSYGLQRNELVSTVGASMGRAVNLHANFALIPFVQGGLVHQYYDMAGVSTITGRPTSVMKRAGAQFGAGLGMRLGQTMTLRPSFSVPTTRFVYGRATTVAFSATYTRNGGRNSNRLPDLQGGPSWRPMGGAKGLSGGMGTSVSGGIIRRLPN